MNVLVRILRKLSGTTTEPTLTVSKASYNSPEIERIINATCDITGVTRNELMSRRRQKEYVYARHIAMYLAREYTTLSFPQIGRAMNKDHTTVYFAAEKLSKRGRGRTKLNRDIAAVKEAAGLNG